MSQPALPAETASATEAAPVRLSPRQWKSGIAAWLGWMFDGLDMHLYTLVAAPFVAQLIGASVTTDPRVGHYGSIIQGAFLFGWALGGGFFGRIGDKLGRARTLNLTILTYALFTGLSFFAQDWWHLMIFRFLAALGIGGEWAVGASLLAETWPRKWRPWIAATLQCGVNIGILGAGLANYLLAAAPPRYIFLVGVLPALLVLWIRRAVPETDEWMAANRAETAEREETARRRIGETAERGNETAKGRDGETAMGRQEGEETAKGRIGETAMGRQDAGAPTLAVSSPSPGLSALFRGETRRITIWVAVVCGISLTAHWAFMFWHQQHLRNLPDVLNLTAQEKGRLASTAMYLVIGSSILGNFFSGWLARFLGYRATIGVTFVAYFVAMVGAYSIPRNHVELLCWFPFIGFCQGVFALFTMYLPPLFPTLLRTTGAGFCYNIGRTVAAAGTIFFGLFSTVGDHRAALFYAGFLFVPAAVISWLLPKVRD